MIRPAVVQPRPRHSAATPTPSAAPAEANTSAATSTSAAPSAAPSASAEASAPSASAEASGHVLPPHLCDLSTVVAMLQRTVDEVAKGFLRQAQRVPGYSKPSHWKGRLLSHRFWNQLGTEPLDQLLLCARAIAEANGSFVPASKLMADVRSASATPSGWHMSSTSKFRLCVLALESPALRTTALASFLAPLTS